ncbi:MAG: MBL fold metallo-hydrolase [Owenweeksia sp.]|nr:MBL fold metallo-hydrolase [Owenweeksia sp.]
MRYTFLGTGTSQGVPIIGCHCPVCRSDDTKDKRLRSSLLVESDTTKVGIDIGPDFRYQMLRNNIDQLDAIVITHEHNDHVAGLDEVRALNFIQQKPMTIYCTESVQAALRKMFYYIFENSAYPGVPKITFKTIGRAPFKVGDITFQPDPVNAWRHAGARFSHGGFHLHYRC